MLPRQNFRRRQQHRLVSVLDRNDGGFRGNQRLAAANVALQQPAHGMRRLHVFGDFLQHALLRAGRFERQHLLDLFAHPIVELERYTWLQARLGSFE